MNPVEQFHRDRLERQRRAAEVAEAATDRQLSTLLPPNRLALEAQAERQAVTAAQREERRREAIAAQAERTRVQGEAIAEYQRFRESIHQAIAKSEQDRRDALERCDLAAAVTAEMHLVAARSLLPRLDEVIRLRFPASFPLMVT